MLTKTEERGTWVNKGIGVTKGEVPGKDTKQWEILWKSEVGYREKRF